MAQIINRLTPRTVASIKRPGLHHDGQGLYRQVTKAGAKSWWYRYEQGGKGYQQGLGSLLAVSLAEVRDKAAACRRLRQQGIDPIEHARRERQARRRFQAKQMTFRDCATACIEAHRAGWSFTLTPSATGWWDSNRRPTALIVGMRGGGGRC